MAKYQGTDYSKQEFFQNQEKIPVELSPKDPTLQPLQNFQRISGIHPSLVRNIQRAGYQQPTPVQKWGIPLLLRGGDVMACAQTGSGKTAFYLFPPINLLLKEGAGWGSQGSAASPRFLVLGPTRELCVQIYEEAVKFTESTPVKVAVVYGGTEMRESLRQLSGGVDLLVATPGRLNDLTGRNQVSLRSIKCLVLDEADRMLDMGFEPQIREIVTRHGMPRAGQRQTVMTSATFPAEVQYLARDFLRDHTFVAVGRVGGASSSIQQKLVWVEDSEKENFLAGLMLHQQQVGLVLIFVNTKQQATDLERFLARSCYRTASIHGDRDQREREQALATFKSGDTPVLIATDVAARGLDIPDVGLVIQYDLAQGTDDYVHRVGRTGRIGKTGMAIGFVNNKNKGVAAELIAIMNGAGSKPPPWLIGMAISNGTYDPNAVAGGDAYGGQDIRKSMKKGFASVEERDAARRFGNFTADAYGQGDASKAHDVTNVAGPVAPGSYSGAAPSKGKGKGKGKGEGKGKGKGKDDGWTGGKGKGKEGGFRMRGSPY